MKEPALECRVVCFWISEARYRDIGNQYPASIGRFVTDGGRYVAETKVQRPRALVATEIGEVSLVGTQDDWQ